MMQTTLRITLELDVSLQVAEQIRRAGFLVQKEGRRLKVRVPNQVVRTDSARIKFEEVTQPA